MMPRVNGLLLAAERVSLVIDLRAAINAISDVVQNRPHPLREFDQVYLKAGDMVLPCEMVACWTDNRAVAFIGGGPFAVLLKN